MDAMWNTLLPLWPPLLLLLVANGAPIVSRLLLGQRLAWPLDGGHLFVDGLPLLGPTKSWRGVMSAVLATTLFSVLLGFPWWMGSLFAVLAMVGDMLASFLKRRLAIAPQGRAIGVDQVPEALLPLWLLRDSLMLDGGQVLLCVLLFMLLEMLLSPLLYRWHLRLRPY